MLPSRSIDIQDNPFQYVQQETDQPVIVSEDGVDKYALISYNAYMDLVLHAKLVEGYDDYKNGRYKTREEFRKKYDERYLR